MLKLNKPGIRGKYYSLRGTLSGRRYEVSTRTTDKDAAEKFRIGFEARAIDNSGPIITYGQATHIYLEKRKQSGIGTHEREMHLRIVSELGRKPLGNITQGEIDRIADLLYPNAKPSTKNRWIIRLIAGVMHYAARSGHCQWLRIHKFKEPKPQTRAVSKNVAIAIIIESGKQKKNADLKKLICLWMFKHGNRISEILSVRGENIDFKQRIFKLYVSKTKTWKTFPLDPEVATALKKAFKDGIPEGLIFPWRHRHSVYKWLRPMCRIIGISFSPHMARHSLGTWFAARGASLRATMERLGHEDAKSSLRYQAGDISVVRGINKKIGALIGGKNVKIKL